MNISEPIFTYESAPATETMHAAPRFGHTNDFSALFSTTETQDYLEGLVFAGAFILAIFLAWLLALAVFKCLGKNRVGFLSGAAFTTSGPRPFYIRIVFINAAILFIVFTILVVTQGLTNLHSAVSTVGDSNDEVATILSNARGISISLSSIGQSTAQVRDELSQNLGNFCPAEPNILALTGIDFDALASQAISLLDQLGDFIENDVNTFQEEIRSAQETSALVGNTVDNIQANDWQALVVLIPYLSLAVFLVIGVFMAWCRRSNLIGTYLLTWLVLPLFILCIIVAFLASAFICLTAVSNADACSGGADKTPDGTVYAVLDAQGLDPQSLQYRAIRYYIEQCTVADDPFGFIRDYQQQIETAQATVATLSDSLQAVTVARLNLICGKDFGPFEGLLATMASNLQILSDNAVNTLDLLSCERIVPIYVNSVYGATCTYSINGVTWTWSAFFVIAFMGMIMITFRSAYLPNDLSGDRDEYDMDSLQEELDYPRKTYLPQSTHPSSEESSPVPDGEAEEVGNHDDDDHSTSDLSSVYIYGADYQVSFDENSQHGGR